MWTYTQRTGNLYNKDGDLTWTGYSGHGEGLNNPEKQNIKGVGPLPCGIYAIGTPFNSEHTGPNAMHLIPDPNNEMFGRGDFEIHGDNKNGNHSASNGCIVHSPAADRLAIWNSGDHQLRVIAEESDRSQLA